MTALRTSGLSKSFGGVEVLSNASLAFAPGRLHALVGENGAAKTTFLRIVAGQLRQTSGEVAGAGPAGTALVPQHGSLAPGLTVLENFALSAAGTGRIDWPELRREAEAALAELGAGCAPDDLASSLPAAEARTAEAARALRSGSGALLLDEPTASVGPARADLLFAALGKAAGGGRTVVFSSHRIDEVLGRADLVHVLRGGKHVLTEEASELTRERLLEAMFGDGADADTPPAARGAASGPPALELRSLACAGLAGKPLDLEVGAGECVAVLGPPDGGRRELAAALSGLAAPAGGEVLVGGERLGGRTMHRWGLRRMPEDPVAASAASSMYVDENLVLHDCFSPSYRRTVFGLSDWPAVAAHAAAAISRDALAVPGPDCVFDWLSGGNRRKLLLARELDGSPKALVAEGIEAGLDHSARAALAARLAALKAAGAGLLLFADDIRFVEGLADRVFDLDGGTLAERRVRS